MSHRRWIVWSLVACQMTAWAWLQFRGGQLNDREYIVFCFCMMLGQIGAGIECLKTKAWGTMVAQAYFFIFTLIGVIIRLAHLR